MSSILLHALDPKNLDVHLHLRLLNAWKLCDPTQPNSFFGFGTHWTDSEFVSGGEPGHIERPNSVALVQKLIVANERGMEVEVSLWGDLAQIIDATPLALNDDSNPTIIAFAAFRITLFSDSTTEASFVLLGMTAERILPISAAELVRAYPNDFGSFPPAIKFLVGQNVEFEVQLPKFNHSNPFGDFKICNIHGLTIPRAELLNKLPTLVPENPFSTPSTHNTPLPGDPDYVAPVPTYVSPTISPQHADDHLLSKDIPAPADQDPLPRHNL
ncbi:hypothetical protein LINPERPRIM_LOCUS2616 [Linum perenne]